MNNPVINSSKLKISQENRGEKTPPHKKKFDFKLCTKNTIQSLNEIEYFLNNIQNISKYIKLYKLLK